MKTKKMLYWAAIATLTIFLTACGGGGSGSSDGGSSGGGGTIVTPPAATPAYTNVKVGISQQTPNWEGACNGSAPSSNGDVADVATFNIQGKLWTTVNGELARSGEKLQVTYRFEGESEDWYTATSSTLPDGCMGYVSSYNFSYGESQYFPYNDPNYFTGGKKLTVTVKAIAADGVATVIATRALTINGDMMPYTAKNPEGFKVYNAANVRDGNIYAGDMMRFHADLYTDNPADMCGKLSWLDVNRKIYVFQDDTPVLDQEVMWVRRGNPERDVAWFDAKAMPQKAGIWKVDFLRYTAGAGCGNADFPNSGFEKHLATGNFVVLPAAGSGGDGNNDTIVVDGNTVPYCPHSPVTSVDSEGRKWGWNGAEGCFVSYN